MSQNRSRLLYWKCEPFVPSTLPAENDIVFSCRDIVAHDISLAIINSCCFFPPCCLSTYVIGTIYLQAYVVLSVRLFFCWYVVLFRVSQAYYTNQERIKKPSCGHDLFIGLCCFVASFVLLFSYCFVLRQPGLFRGLITCIWKRERNSESAA